MSLPILHSIVGASIVALCYPKNSLSEDWKFLLLGSVIAVSPDLDYFLVYWYDMCQECHRSYTHSIFFALAITWLGLLLTGFTRIKRILVCGAALLSHGILDFLVAYENAGVKLFHPFSETRYQSNLSDVFIRTANSPHELINQAVLEFAVSAPLLLLILLVREYVSGGKSASAGSSGRIKKIVG
jgi:membrane-bound metal-dependent hydrolase YbcI (DUF457 family)